MKTFFELREKTLTPAELKKREEIAKAIKRENPNMPMAKKMAIATATAKKVAEDASDVSYTDNDQIIEQAAIYLIDENIDVDELSEEQINELLGSIVKGVAKLAYKGIKKAVVNKKGHFRFSTAGKADAADNQAKKLEKMNRDRVRLRRAQERIRKARERAANEEVDLTELSKKTLGNYIKTAGPDRERRTKSATGLSTVGHDIRGHDPEQAKKLFSRAGSELHKAANRKVGINKAVNKLVGEEAELDEVSAATLGNYSIKAARQGNNRLAGQKMADEKMRKKDGYSSSAKVAAGSRSVTKEEVKLDEISQSTKDRYVQQSAKSHQNAAAVSRDAKSRGDQAAYDKARAAMKKRNAGMTRAFGE